MKKIKKIQGAPAGRVKGSSQGSSLEPLRIRERRDSHGQKPPTRRDPGSWMFLIFFVFWPFRKKSKKIIDFFDFLVFRKNQKNQKNPGCPRRESQGLQPGLQPGATQDPGEEGFPRPETPHAERPRVPDFFHFFDFFDFFRFLAFSKKSKKSKKSRVPPQGESRAPARAPAWSHSGSGRGGIPTARNPPRGETQGPGFFSFFLIFLIFLRFLAFSKKSKKSKKFC